MGFRKQPKRYRLTFEDSQYDGFECVVGSMSLAEMLQISQMGIDIQAGNTQDIHMDTQFRLFADAIVSWNLEDEDGVAIPPSFEALKAQDMDFVSDLLKAWMTAVSSVSRPLGDGSTSGGTSAALLDLMDESSVSRRS